MTINIETLRFEIQLNKLDNSQMVLSPLVVGDLIDRLETAESTRRDDYQNWMTALDRNAELLAKLEAVEKERDAAELMSLALRAKIAEMERQEPTGTLYDDGCFVWRNGRPHETNYAGWKMALYALPGAKGEDK